MKPILLVLLIDYPLGPTGAESLAGRLDLSLSAGLALPGTIEASLVSSDFPPESTASFVSRASPVGRLQADYFLLPSLGPSLALNYSMLRLGQDVDLGFWDGRQHTIPKDDLHFVEIEGGIKYRHAIGRSFTVEPALYLGYCHIFSSSPDARDNGFILDLAADLQWRRSGFHLLSTAGIMTQLYGGVEGVAWVRSYPVVYLTAGVGL